MMGETDRRTRQRQREPKQQREPRPRRYTYEDGGNPWRFGCQCGAQWKHADWQHCGSCHETFGSDAGMLRHYDRETGECVAPERMGFVWDSKRGGVWSRRGIGEIKHRETPAEWGAWRQWRAGRRSGKAAA